MIAGLTAHDGNIALALHLSKADDNEAIEYNCSGLTSGTIVDGINELRMMGRGSRSGKSLLHLWASPSRNYSPREWEEYWFELEQEFDLLGHPYVEVRHLKFGKGGRSAGHVHRAYLRIGSDGRVLSIGHSAARLEKLSRLAEYRSGEPFTSGRFNRSVIQFLRKAGRADVADAMVRAGLHSEKAHKAVSPAERAMTERLSDLAADEVWSRVAQAWCRSDSGAAFNSALAEQGLTIAMGDKIPVVVSPGGARHPLLRALNQGLARSGLEKIRKADLDLRIASVVLPKAENITARANYDAGVFAITGVTRNSQSFVDKTNTADLVFDVLSGSDFSLTSEQRAALLALQEELGGRAEQSVREFRQKLEAETREVLQRSVDSKLEAYRELPEQAGIAPVSWRDRYRARLVGLPEDLGGRLRWVDVSEPHQHVITLKDGSELILEPDRVSTVQELTHDAAAFMVVLAQQKNWEPVTITGSPEARVRLARMAANEGLLVADEDLQEVIAEQHRANSYHPDVEHFLELRVMLAKAHSDEDMEQAFKTLMPIFKSLHEAGHLRALAMTPQEQELFRQDIELCAAWKSARSARLGSPRP